MKCVSCIECEFLAEMVSHPTTDGFALSNKLGYACVVFYMLSEQGERGPICPNWKPHSIGCEMFIKKRGKAKGSPATVRPRAARTTTAACKRKAASKRA